MRLSYHLLEQELVSIYESKFKKFRTLYISEILSLKTRLETIHHDYVEVIFKTCNYQPVNFSYFLYSIEFMHSLILRLLDIDGLKLTTVLRCPETFIEVYNQDITNGRLEEIYKLLWFEINH